MKHWWPLLLLLFATQAWGAVAPVCSFQSTNPSAPSISICSGTAGYVYVASIASYDGDPINSVPSGWTLIQSTDNTAGSIILNTYWHRSAGSEPPSYSWACSGNCYAAGGIEAYSGAVASGSPIDLSSTNTNAVANGSEVALSINLTQTNEYVVSTCGDNATLSAGTWTSGTPEWFTAAISAVSEMSAYADQAGPAGGGATGNNTYAVTAALWACQQIGIIAAASGPTPTPTSAATPTPTPVATPTPQVTPTPLCTP